MMRSGRINNACDSWKSHPCIHWSHTEATNRYRNTMSGIVVLVRRDAAAAAAALLPGGGANDRRCILYTSLIQSPHCVVQIQTQQCGAACFAQLREPLEDDENKDDAMLSRGLWTALHLDDGEMSGEGVELIVRDVDEEPAARTNPAKCACEHGEVGSVELHFVDRTEPPRAVANGLKRVLVKVCCGHLMAYSPCCKDVSHARICVYVWVKRCSLCKSRRFGTDSEFHSIGSIFRKMPSLNVSSGNEKAQVAVLLWGKSQALRKWSSAFLEIIVRRLLLKALRSDQCAST